MTKKISIIGCGNMGSAIYNGLKTFVSNDDLFLCDSHREKFEALSPAHSSSDVSEAITFGEFIILAIKPQSFDDFCRSASGNFDGKVALSIMAGISVQTIQNKLKCQKVIRSMPNLGSQVRMGVTGWAASQEVAPDEKDFAEKLFTSFGFSIELSDESKINNLTVISGCGPAYFFYLTELLAQKAEELGFSNEDARRMTEQTFFGSAELLKNGKKTAKEWREAVSSKGGITEKAIQTMQEKGLDEIFGIALDEAKKRAEELD